MALRPVEARHEPVDSNARSPDPFRNRAKHLTIDAAAFDFNLAGQTWRHREQTDELNGCVRACCQLARGSWQKDELGLSAQGKRFPIDDGIEISMNADDDEKMMWPLIVWQVQVSSFIEVVDHTAHVRVLAFGKHVERPLIATIARRFVELDNPASVLRCQDRYLQRGLMCRRPAARARPESAFNAGSHATG
jgi:hypothetical protein